MVRVALLGLLIAVSLCACKGKTVVDKQLAENDKLRAEQLAAERQEEGEKPALLRRMNWRVIQVASSFTPIGRKRIDAIGDPFAWKVDIYETSGDNAYDRVDLDLDRDGTIDETWKRKDGTWTKFDGRLFWNGREWRQAGRGAMVLPNVATQTEGGEPLFVAARAMLYGKASNYEEKDLFAGKGPHIALHDDDWDAKWDRAEVDRDRDGKIDERWVRTGDELIREVLADKRKFVFTGDRWVQQAAE